MSLSAEASGNIIKAINTLCALVLIGLSIYKFVYKKDMDVLNGIWTFYWIIFGLMILVSEIRFTPILKFINFLESCAGKGLFIIFCGTLLIDRFDDESTYESIIGIIFILLGVCDIFIGKYADPSPSFPPSIGSPESNQEN